MRIQKTEYYLRIAKTVSERSSCLRRKYGAVIVRNDAIISTGFNGSPRGTTNCCDTGICMKNINNIDHGVGYMDYCASVHAEQNAIIHASRSDMLDSELYLAGIDYELDKEMLDVEPCSICMRMIINAGIETLVTRKGYEGSFSNKFNIVKIADVVNSMKNGRIEKE